MTVIHSVVSVLLGMGLVQKAISQELNISCDQYQRLRTFDDDLKLQNIYGLIPTNKNQLQQKQCVFSFIEETTTNKKEDLSTTIDDWFGFMYKYKGCIRGFQNSTYAVPQFYVGFRPNDYPDNVPLAIDEISLLNEEDNNFYKILKLKNYFIEPFVDFNFIFKTYFVKRDPTDLNTNKQQICEIQIHIYRYYPLDISELKLVTNIIDTFGTSWLVYKLQFQNKCLYKIIFDPEQIQTENAQTILQKTNYINKLYGGNLVSISNSNSNSQQKSQTQTDKQLQSIFDCGRYIKVASVEAIICKSYIDFSILKQLQSIDRQDVGNTFITSYEFGTEIDSCNLQQNSGVVVVSQYSQMTPEEIQDTQKPRK